MMKRLLIILFLALPCHGQMLQAIVGRSSAASSPPAAVIAYMDTAADGSGSYNSAAHTLVTGETVVVCASGNVGAGNASGKLWSISDSATNTYTNVNATSIDAGANFSWYDNCAYSINVTGGTVTWTVGRNLFSNSTMVAIYRLSGVTSFVNKASAKTTCGGTWASGTVTTTGASIFVGYLFIGAATNTGATGWTLGASNANTEYIYSKQEATGVTRNFNGTNTGCDYVTALNMGFQ